MVWVGILLVSFVWLYAAPVNEPTHWAWTMFLVGGVAAFASGLRRAGECPIPRRYAMLCLPLAVFSAVVGWPYNLGAITLMAALALGTAFERFRAARILAHATGFAGLVLLVQAAVWPVYAHLAARLHAIPILNPVVAWAVGLAGGRASFDRESLFVQTSGGVGQLFTTWESLGMFTAVNLFLGGALVVLFREDARRNLLKLTLTLIGYVGARYLVLVLAFAAFDTSDLFWRRPWIVVGFSPLAVLLSAVGRTRSRMRELPVITFSKRALATGGLVALAMFALCGSVLFQDPGVGKAGRVLFDEGHSDWEWMDRKFDTEWYGQQSTYNYYSLGEYVRHYRQADIKREKLTPELLAKYDVLVLKTPTSAYAPEEIGAIKSFVRRGGGLFLIGDHTNVFGTGSCLNDVAREFGYRFKYDSTYDLASGNLSLFEPSSVARHPVLNDVPSYLFATSCSLQAPIWSENVIVGNGLLGLYADYSQRSFFPKDPHAATAMEFGLLLQMAGSKHGDGRVLLYTDSTCFSNFSMFLPGKPELFLGALEWLNRRNRYGFVNYGLAVLSLAAAVGAGFTARRGTDAGTFVWGVAALLIGGASGLWVTDALNRRFHESPRPHTPYTRLLFDAEHSDFDMPMDHLETRPEKDIQTFYVWTQRVGLMPRVDSNFQNALATGDAVVVMNPNKPFTRSEVDAFVRFVERGGKALVMDDPRNIKTSTAHQLLGPFGAKIEFYEIPEGTLVDQAGETIWTGGHIGTVRGGEPLLFARTPSPVPDPSNPTASGSDRRAQTAAPSSEGNRPAAMSVIRSGQGTLIVSGCSSMFTLPEMGSISTVPNEAQRKLYEFEYRIWRDVLALRTQR